MAVREQTTTKTGLVLDSLEVKNFRAFKHLTIEKLGRVNLITGKNNVGKTSLLEAVRVYLSFASPQNMYILLSDRDEISDPLRFSKLGGLVLRKSDSEISSSPYTSGQNPGWGVYLASFFHNRSDINDLGEPFVIRTRNHDQSLKFHLTFLDPVTKLAITGEEAVARLLFAEPIVEITIGQRSEIRRLEEYERSQFLWMGSEPKVHARFVSASGGDSGHLAVLWDKVVLKPAEDQVISLLRLIDSRVDRLTFRALNEDSRIRVPYIRMEGLAEPVPLRRLGDGINRLLEITLSIADCQDGVVLIDEIDNGLHYSVLFEVWHGLFRMAETLNVQVLATTHSWECIEAFQAAAAESPEEGMLVKLKAYDGDIEAVEFDEEELEVIAGEQIEVR